MDSVKCQMIQYLSFAVGKVTIYEGFFSKFFPEIPDRFTSQDKVSPSIDEGLNPYMVLIFAPWHILRKPARFRVNDFLLYESDTGYISDIEIQTTKSLDGKVNKMEWKEVKLFVRCLS